MSGFQVLLDRIILDNKTSLDSYGVSLKLQYLDFSNVTTLTDVPGYNTRVTVTATGGDVRKGSTMDYFYNRNPLGSSIPDDATVGVSDPYDIPGVLDVINYRFGTSIDESEVDGYLYDPLSNTITIDMKDTSIVWTGTITIELSDIELTDVIRIQELDGLSYSPPSNT